MYKHEFRKLVCIVLLALFCLCGIAAADDQPTPSPMPIPEGASVAFSTYSSHNDIYRLKETLFNFGYYPSFVSESDLKNNTLDDFTMVAVQKCCIANGLEYQQYGIVPNTWSAILNGSILAANVTPSPSPSPETYHHIYWGEHSDGVRMFQQRLQELGFGSSFDPGLYNEALRDAIYDFCVYNHITYDQTNGISVDLQALVLESGDQYLRSTATPTPTETDTGRTTAATDTRSLVEKIRDYFMSNTVMFGLKIPTLVLWAVSLLLIIGCILLVFHFFINGDENARRPGSSKSTRRSSEGITLGSGKIEFKIEYKGIVKHYRCDIQQKEMLIGRGVGKFPLEMEDTTISRKHCGIYYLNRGLMIRDYSINGTTVNGKSCFHGEYMLTSGDVIQIGDHRITIIF